MRKPLTPGKDEGLPVYGWMGYLAVTPAAATVDAFTFSVHAGP